MIRRNPNPLGIQAFEDNKRQGGRINVAGVLGLFGGSTFGTVINMSSSGILMMRPGKISHQVGDVFQMELRWGALEVYPEVNVAWVKHVGFRKWMIGLAFEDLSDEEAVVVKQMALRAAQTDGAMSFKLHTS